MVKKYRVLLVSLLTLMLLTSSTIFAYASNAKDTRLGKHTITVDDKSIEVNVTSDDGRYVVTCNDPILINSKDQKYIDALDQFTNSLVNTEPEAGTEGYISGWDKWESIAYCFQSNDTYKCTSRNTVKFNHLDTTKVDVNASGSIAGYYYGQGYPTSIKLQESLSISGTSVSISWPPGFSSSGSSASFVSDNFTGVTYASSPYSGVYGMSYVALFSFTQNDTAIIRYNNTDYRPSSTIYTNWLTGECTTNPDGSTTHTYS